MDPMLPPAGHRALEDLAFRLASDSAALAAHPSVSRGLARRVRAERLPEGAFPVVREALITGDVEHAHARELTGYREH